MELVISKDLSINANKLVTGRTCIIGQSGSGKSYVIGVICEELLKNGIGFCIIDTEGEYFTLKEKYPILWVGSSKNCEINIEDIDIKILAKKVYERGFPLILDISEIDGTEIISKFLKIIFDISTKIKQPYLIIVEEADKFVPQIGKKIKEIEEISKRGRKRGIGLLLVTQRPASLDKNVLSQCGNQIIGKLTIKSDLEAVRFFFQNKDDVKKLPLLRPGQFIIQGEISEQKLVQIRKRETAHKAIAPKIRKKVIKTRDLEQIEVELKEKVEKEPDIEEFSVICVEPKISEEVAFERIKKATRRFKFFGKGALISNLHLVLRPIFSCEIKYLKKKIIGHEFITIHTYFDGINGNIVSLEKEYSVITRISDLLGLSTTDLEVFNVILKKKKVTTSEVSYQLKKSQESVRLSLKQLIKKGIVGVKRIGRSRFYYPFIKVKFPKIKKIAEKQVKTSRLKLKCQKFEPEIKLEDLRAFVRSLGEKIDIISERKIYYPFYVANFFKKNKKEKIIIDGVSGKVVKL